MNVKNFFNAYQIGDLLEMERCIGNGVNINAVDDDNWTALMLACRDGRDNIVQYLVDKGADMTLENKDNRLGGIIGNEIGRTAIDIAVLCHNPHLVNILIKNNPLILKHSSIVSIFHKGHEESFRYLLKNNYEMEIDALHTATYNNHVEAIHALLNNGFDIDFIDGEGNSAVMCINDGLNNHDAIKLLIHKGANLDIKNHNGETAYDRAKDNDKMHIMVELRPDLVNTFDENDLSLLMKSCLNYNEKEILFLYEKGANFLIENKSGVSAIKLLDIAHNISNKMLILKEKINLASIINDEIIDSIAL